MSQLLPRLVLALLWLLHFLPLPFLRALGWMLGVILFHTARARRHVVDVNLRLCFPEWNASRRRAVARRHFVLFAQSALDRALFWWASPRRLARLIQLSGLEHLEAARNAPVLILAPHFLGLDAGGVVLSMRMTLASVYSRQKNSPVFDAALKRGRERFNAPILLSRQEGMRKPLKAMKQGVPFYYLPDMDFGRDESLFVSFFGVLAATIPGVSRLVRATGAQVIPCIGRLTRKGYAVELLPAWTAYPGESVEADTRRMNRFIESQVSRDPAQYYWLHKRFKTRPPGEPKPY